MGLLVSTVIASAPAHAKDTLKLKNGDVLSGQISTYSTNGVTIQTAYGVFDIPVNHIGGVESPRYSMEDLFNPAMPAANQTPMAAPTDASPPRQSQFSLAAVDASQQSAPAKPLLPTPVPEVEDDSATVETASAATPEKESVDKNETGL